MSDQRHGRGARRLATRIYMPQPVRSFGARLAASFILCTACVAVGAAAATWHARHSAAPAQPCAEPPSESLVQAELTRTQLSLAKEEAARAALQKIADSSAAEVSRLETELRFLRGQRDKRR